MYALSGLEAPLGVLQLRLPQAGPVAAGARTVVHMAYAWRGPGYLRLWGTPGRANGVLVVLCGSIHIYIGR